MEQANFDAMVVKYRTQIYAYLYRRCRDHAEDLTQQVFMRAWRHCNELRDPPKGWLFRTAENIFYDQLRRLDARRELPLAYVQVDPSSGGVSDIELALLRLPDETREILELKYFGNCTLEDIAEIYGYCVGTAHTKLHRAKKQLRELLGGNLQLAAQGERA